VVGAGLAGLSAARKLADHGHNVSVFEKGRGVGGRTAWRREGEYRFDHGAQYFTVRDPRFRHYVTAWCDAGIVSPWEFAVGVARAGAVTPKPESVQRYVGVPGMNAMAKHLGAELDIVLNTQVGQIERSSGQWRLLSGDTGIDLGQYDVVIIATPPAQAVPLLAAAPQLAQQAKAVQLAPCWAVMAAFTEPLDIPFDGVFIHASPLSWATRNASKPGRPQSECWVLHSTPEWSAKYLEKAPDEVIAASLAAFFAATGLMPSQPVLTKAHRWRYSIAEQPLEQGCLWDSEQQLGSCGDWCQGSRIEGAVLSGLAMADRVLGLSNPVKVTD
jgi:predicted NAD/FAD-dependent oxidoreductase